MIEEAQEERARIMAQHRHTPEEEREIREAALDDTIEASFPASDPPSSDPNPDDDAVLEREVVTAGKVDDR